MVEQDLLIKMVRLIEELSNMRTPIVFKGAMVLKTALSGITLNTERMTRDIDGDWISTPPSMEELENLINKALYNVDITLRAVAYRNYGLGKSAGFNILDSAGRKVFSIDISMKDNPYYIAYTTNINQIKFYGSAPEKMFADKLRGISTVKIYRRVKDLYDLYLLSALNGYSSIKITSILGNTIGDFKDFRECSYDLKHAYNKLNRVTNKPSFKEVYSNVYEFIRPFLEGYSDQNLMWADKQWYNKRGR